MQKYGITGAAGKVNYLVRKAQEKAVAGDHKTAVEYLEKVIDTAPQHAEAYALMGDCYGCIGEHEQAIAYYDQALHIDPFHADAWFNKGTSLRMVGREEEAAQCIEKSIELYRGK
ncbi:MAG: hypothetical protein APR53_02395 [Methanoculleus sp. SDB]|nr:MAG: hypothetical protein APR53_02395 [Methanoculleus sp. SDB]